MTDQFTIPAVEIFRAGTWNGATSTEADLDAMVEASTRVGFVPPVKLGHATESGMPAFGWVENLRRMGASLMADLVELPEQLYAMIKARRYNAMSVEIYHDLERNGRTFPRVLRALALLGAELPAVDLRPLRDYLPQDDLPRAVYTTYAIEPPKIYARDPLNDALVTLDPNADVGWQEAGDMLLRYAKSLCSSPTPSAAELRAAIAEAKRAYPRLAGIYDRKDSAAAKMTVREISDEVSRRVVELRHHRPALSYHEAYDTVLKDEQIKRRYAAS